MHLLRLAAAATLSTTLIAGTGVPSSAAPATDVTPPVITGIGLTEGQLIGLNSTFTPIVSDDVGVFTVDVLINGKYVNSLGSHQGRFIGWVYLADQRHDTEIDVTLQARDRAGNTAKKTVRVRTDTQKPTAGSITPDESTVISGVATITVADVPPDTALIHLSRGFGSEPFSTATAAPWTLRWDSRTVAWTSGSYYVTVVDHAGNTTEYRRTHPIDNTGPGITASASYIPAVIGGGVQGFAVDYDKPADVARIEWWIDGAVRATTQAGQYDFGRVDRTVDIEARAFDEHGNVSVLTRRVRIDATGPTVTSVTPAPGLVVRNGATVSTEIKASDPAGIGEVVLIDPYLGRHSMTAAPYRKSVPVVGGPAQLTWHVYDQWRNMTVVRRTVIADQETPVLKVTKAPKNGAKVKGTVQVTASAWDRYGIARVELLVNGKVAARDTAAAYKFAINTKKYGKKIKVQLRAYDRVGNVTWTPARTWKR